MASRSQTLRLSAPARVQFKVPAQTSAIITNGEKPLRPVTTANAQQLTLCKLPHRYIPCVPECPLLGLKL